MEKQCKHAAVCSARHGAPLLDADLGWPAITQVTELEWHLKWHEEQAVQWNHHHDTTSRAKRSLQLYIRATIGPSIRGSHAMSPGPCSRLTIPRMSSSHFFSWESDATSVPAARVAPGPDKIAAHATV